MGVMLCLLFETDLFSTGLMTHLSQTGIKVIRFMVKMIQREQLPPLLYVQVSLDFCCEMREGRNVWLSNLKPLMQNSFTGDG